MPVPARETDRLIIQLFRGSVGAGRLWEWDLERGMKGEGDGADAFN
jgi:hypothetical protein